MACCNASQGCQRDSRSSSTSSSTSSNGSCSTSSRRSRKSRSSTSARDAGAASSGQQHAKPAAKRQATAKAKPKPKQRSQRKTCTEKAATEAARGVSGSRSSARLPPKRRPKPTGERARAWVLCGHCRHRRLAAVCRQSGPKTARGQALGVTKARALTTRWAWSRMSFGIATGHGCRCCPCRSGLPRTGRQPRYPCNCRRHFRRRGGSHTRRCTRRLPLEFGLQDVGSSI